MNIQEDTLHGWKALRLSTAALDLVAPLEIGPRILHFSPAGGKNLLYNFPDQMGGRNETDYCLRGGHRLWHSPEHSVRTYQPDNDPVESRVSGNGFTLEGRTEQRTGIRKTIELEVVDERTVRLNHTLTNEGLWPVECAVWPLTMLNRGGTGAVPLNPKGEHPRDLLPSFSVVPWTYTDFSEPCWKFHPGYLRIDTTKAAKPQKLGLTGYPGWSAYWLDGAVFVKEAPVVKGGVYPDLGCVFETFCDTTLIELETLSPLRTLAPGESVSHAETWGLLEGVACPDSEKAYQDSLLPAVEAWRKRH